MSKAVRWQVPFAAHDGTRYRVDIYDEGYTGNPVVLTAGETPFTTDEDDSDDFFAPVRTQTGTLQVCTDIEGSNTPLKLEDILPANNIARPVRLLKYANGSYSVIEWQGFLSCEAYSQDYIGIPQNLDLPLISVLEAMASVEVDPAKLSGLNTVGATITQLLEIFIEKAGVSYFSEYYVPTIARGRNIVSKYIDATILFKQKEYNNENSTTYIVSGLSLQDCLARIATYMGWCLREKSGTLYFMAANETVSYNRRYRQGWADMQGYFSYRWMMDMSDTAVSTQDIDDLDWMGNGHQRSVAQGAKSVEVVANLDKYELDMSLPEFPAGDVSTYYLEMNYNRQDSEFWSRKWWYMVASQNDTAYSSLKLGFRKLNKQSNGAYHCFDYGNSTIQDVLAHMLEAGDASTARQGAYAPATGSYTYHAGAFFAKESFEDSQQQTHDTEEGLHCVFFPYTIRMTAGSQTPPDFDPSQSGYIAQMSSVVNFSANSGYINLQCDYSMLYWHWADQGTHLAVDSGDASNVWRCGLRLKFGDKYWNGSSWQSTACLFEAPFKGGNFQGNWSDSMGIPETDGLLIPISSAMNGEVVLEIWPNVSMLGNTFNWWVFESFFKRMDVSYIALIDDALTDRSENHYFRLLGTHFRDEVSISTDLASSLNNQPSPSLIMNDQTTPMTMLNYGSDMRRPEVDLLNRLATYYGAARQRLELEVAHITTPLPMLRLNGINDGNVYLPLAESRDWRTGVCKLTCFECPS